MNYITNEDLPIVAFNHDGTVKKWPVATFCGSMRYYPRMLALAAEFTSHGIICILPHVAVPHVNQKGSDFKEMLDAMHRVKMDMADYVIQVGEHIGESTAAELAYASEKGILVMGGW